MYVCVSQGWPKMSDLTEENFKKSNSAQETSAEGNASPEKDASGTQKQLV